MKDSLTLALDVDRFMRRLHANLRPKAQVIDEEDIGPLGGMVIIAIAEAEPISVQALARQLARDKAQMTRILQMLERKELLSRSQNAHDKRVSLIQLTAKGHQRVKGFQAALAEVVEDLLHTFEDAEVTAFSSMLRKALSTEVDIVAK